MAWQSICHRAVTWTLWMSNRQFNGYHYIQRQPTSIGGRAVSTLAMKAASTCMYINSCTVAHVRNLMSVAPESRTISSDESTVSAGTVKYQLALSKLSPPVGDSSSIQRTYNVTGVWWLQVAWSQGEYLVVKWKSCDGFLRMCTYSQLNNMHLCTSELLLARSLSANAH